jgi:protein-L-isoaspartate(D-aspartate) O-methyltransferase
VVGVEHIEALREMGERNARKDERVAEWVDDGRVRFVKGDGRLGWREGAPWDAIVSFRFFFCLDGLEGR